MSFLSLVLAATINLSPIGEKDSIKRVISAADSGNEVVFDEGTYHFHREHATDLHFYVSNHDQPIPRKVFLPIIGKRDLVLRGEGKGAKFVFHGRGMGLLLRDTKNLRLENISIDWSVPTIGEAVITELDKKNKKCAAEWVVKCCWDNPNALMLWDQDTKSIVPGTGDAFDIWKGRIGDRISYRVWSRPNPAVCLYSAEKTAFKDFVIHAAFGMGILAQRSSDIEISGGGIYPREGSFTSTMADATHFSNCRGLIVSKGATYAGMMDDAINVHSTCLKIVAKTGKNRIKCRYMHHQAIGFEVFEPGEIMRFIHAKTLENGEEVMVSAVKSLSPTEVEIEYEVIAGKLPRFEIGDAVENATFQPAVEFVGNTVKNNRARGTLFTTPKPVLVENNLFENVSGTAILLAGDAGGWFESGACHDVVIRGNKFVNCLTSAYQFCEAVITAYPMVADLAHQKTPYHKTVIVENNIFDCPSKKLDFFLSTEKVIWRDNVVVDSLTSDEAK